MINFLRALGWGEGSLVTQTVNAKIGTIPNKLGDNLVTWRSTMQSSGRAWTENWVPNIFLLAAVPAEVVTLVQSLTL